MHQSILRFLSFLVGLTGLRLAEILASHHPPVVPLRPRWFTNLSLGLLNGAIVSLACVACLLFSGSRAVPFALPLLVHLPPFLRVLAEVALLDLLTYLLHRSYHVIPLLWRLHVAHHSDLDLDVSSASRFHPGEVLLSALVKVITVILVGISPVGLVIFEAAMLACAQFQHSNISLPAALEGWLWRTLVPPEMHRLHHTPTVRDTNSNYGTILTVWDRLFGTLNARPRQASEAFGVLHLPNATWPHQLLLLPFRAHLCSPRNGAA